MDLRTLGVAGMIGVVAVAGGSCAAAQVAASTFTTGQSWSPYSPAWPSTATIGSPVSGLGYRFTSLTTGTVQWIDAGIFAHAPSSNGVPITMAVRNDVSGFVGSAIGSFATTPADFVSSPGAPKRFMSPEAIDLVAGQTYWLTVDLTSAGGFGLRWYHGDNSVGARELSTSLFVLGVGPVWSGGGAPEPRGAFEIVTPAPGAAGLLGIAFLLAERRRR